MSPTAPVPVCEKDTVSQSMIIVKILILSAMLFAAATSSHLGHAVIELYAI